MRDFYTLLRPWRLLLLLLPLLSCDDGREMEMYISFEQPGSTQPAIELRAGQPIDIWTRISDASGPIEYVRLEGVPAGARCDYAEDMDLYELDAADQTSWVQKRFSRGYTTFDYTLQFNPTGNNCYSLSSFQGKDFVFTLVVKLQGQRTPLRITRSLPIVQ